MRYFIDLMYDGKEYHGWQRQKNALSVQEILEDALKLFFGEKTETVGSGRTDTGVHAIQQIVHFDVAHAVNGEKIRDKLNSYLPGNIAIREIWEVAPEAHARFDAIRRCYEYRITRVKDPFLAGRAYYFRRALDLGLMNEAARVVMTTSNFQSFSRVKTEVNHFICRVYSAFWEKADEMIIFSICADRFLRGMVRTLVGTMLDVGEGKISLSGFGQVIEKGDRKAAGRAVPPYGLYLKSVVYPDWVYEGVIKKRKHKGIIE